MLGVPFNLLQISYVVRMMAQVSNLSPGRVKYLFGDVHIYKNHLEGLSTQLERTPLDHYPQLILDKSVKDYNDFKLEHFGITKYVHQGKIELPVSV